MATVATAKSPRVFVDTNFLFDLANNTRIVWEALETIRERLHKPLICVPPTVIDELVAAHDDPGEADEHKLASIALTKLRAEWKFQPMDLVPVGHGIVEQVAEKIRGRGLIPEDEVNDSFILAETALLCGTILVTADKHLLEVPAGNLRLLLDECDVECPLIVSPRKIARDFFLRK